MSSISIGWIRRLPGYSIVRLLGGSHSKLEAKYHSRRRASSLAAMCDCSLADVAGALREAEESTLLQEVNERASKHSWKGGFRACPELYAVCRLLKPALVIETGVGSGLSSSHILQALELNQNGTLMSVDLPNADPGWKLDKGDQPGFLVPEKLKTRWKLMLGDSNVVLKKLFADGVSPDIFFHDSEHSYETMKFEFELSWNHLRDGGVIISDDAVWNTAMLELAKDNGRRLGFFYHKGGSFPVPYLVK